MNYSLAYHNHKTKQSENKDNLLIPYCIHYTVSLPLWATNLLVDVHNFSPYFLKKVNNPYIGG